LSAITQHFVSFEVVFCFGTLEIQAATPPFVLWNEDDFQLQVANRNHLKG